MHRGAFDTVDRKSGPRLIWSRRMQALLALCSMVRAGGWTSREVAGRRMPFRRGAHAADTDLCGGCEAVTCNTRKTFPLPHDRLYQPDGHDVGQCVTSVSTDVRFSGPLCHQGMNCIQGRCIIMHRPSRQRCIGPRRERWATRSGRGAMCRAVLRVVPEKTCQVALRVVLEKARRTVARVVPEEGASYRCPSRTAEEMSGCSAIRGTARPSLMGQNATPGHPAGCR